MEHALNYRTGGFTIIRHNEGRDHLAVLLSEVCHDVSIEPHLQPLSGESLHGSSANIEDGARLEVAADGFWGRRFERAFFDVRVFNPHAPSNQTSQIATSYRHNENEKRQVYKQSVREIEHASFTPFVLSCIGGIGPSVTITLKGLRALLADKHNSSYSMVMGLLRCHLSFALIRSAIMCICGSRSSRRHPCRPDFGGVDVAIAKGNGTFH